MSIWQRTLRDSTPLAGSSRSDKSQAKRSRIIVSGLQTQAFSTATRASEQTKLRTGYKKEKPMT